MARTPDETRQRLIDAGLAALRELTAADLVTAIGTQRLAAAAGVSKATLFHHFGSVEEYASALIARVYDPDLHPIGQINEQIRSVTDAPMSTEAGLEAHRAQFTRMINDPDLRLRIGLWAFGGADATRTYGDFLRETDGRHVPHLEELYASWGREISSPFDPESVLAALTSTLAGSAIRHLADPDSMTIDRYARSTMSLNLALLRLIGDPRSLDDRLAEVNYYGPERNPEARPATRSRVLAAASDLIDRRGVDQVSMTQIARAAHVGTSTLYDLFDGKQDLIDHLVRERAAAAIGHDAADLPEALEDVARFAAAQTDVMPFYLRALAGEVTRHRIDALVDHVRGSIEVEQAAGRLEPALDAQDAATDVTAALVRQVVRHGADGPRAAVAHVLRLTDRSAKPLASPPDD